MIAIDQGWYSSSVHSLSQPSASTWHQATINPKMNMTRCFEWHTDCISAIGVFLFGCSNGRHDQVIRNAADKHQLTHPAMGLIPLLPQMIIKEGTYQLRSLAMDKSMTPSPLPSVINGSTTLCNCHSKRKPTNVLASRHWSYFCTWATYLDTEQ